MQSSAGPLNVSLRAPVGNISQFIHLRLACTLKC